jgi:hypothetical protein
MPAPKAAPALCDAPGCGRIAVTCTDGTEDDTHPRPSPDLKKRKAIANINVCGVHTNWAFSEDAARFAASDIYRARTAQTGK